MICPEGSDHCSIVNYKSGGVTFTIIICPEGSVSLFISPEGVTFTFIICPEGSPSFNWSGGGNCHLFDLS